MVMNRSKKYLTNGLPTEAPDLRGCLKPESRGRFTAASAAVLILQARLPVPVRILRAMLGYSPQEFNVLLGAGLVADGGVEVALPDWVPVESPSFRAAIKPEVASRLTDAGCWALMLCHEMKLDPAPVAEMSGWGYATFLSVLADALSAIE